MTDQPTPKNCPLCGQEPTTHKFNDGLMARCSNIRCPLFGRYILLDAWQSRPGENALTAELAATRADANKAASECLKLIDNVTAFAGQLQAWNLDEAAKNLIVEVLGDKVHAPDYYALRDENTQLREAAKKAVDIWFAPKAGEDYKELMAMKALRAALNPQEKEAKG